MKFLITFSAACVVFLESMGCSPAPPAPPALDPIEEACGGERPANTVNCSGQGVFWADCGGDGGPILACHEFGGRCAWFSHGCAPVGFRATACPIGDPCCESTSDGTWPFAESWRPSGPMGPVLELVEDVAAVGYAPVTESSPSGVLVMIDPSLPPAPPGVSCDGSGVGTLEICDGNPLLNWTPVSSGDTIMVRFVNRAISAETLILEIVPRISGPIARTFVRRDHDASPPEPALSCEQARSPRLDLTGALTINGIDVANPSATHGHLVLDLPDGGHATIDF